MRASASITVAALPISRASLTARSASSDFTEDLRAISAPVLIMHGEDDQIVPIADSALLSAKLVKDGTLKTYPGLSHGMATTNSDLINADILAFINS